MKFLWLWLSLLTLDTVVAAPPRRLVEDLRSASELSAIRRVEELPTPIRASLARVFKQKRLFLGNPSEPLAEELSIPGTPNHPERRLMFAFTTRNYVVVYVEYAAPAVHASALTFERNRARFAWGAVDWAHQWARSPKDLANRIATGSLHEERRLIW